MLIDCAHCPSPASVGQLVHVVLAPRVRRRRAAVRARRAPRRRRRCRAPRRRSRARRRASFQPSPSFSGSIPTSGTTQTARSSSETKTRMPGSIAGARDACSTKCARASVSVRPPLRFFDMKRALERADLVHEERSDDERDERLDRHQVLVELGGVVHEDDERDHGEEQADDEIDLAVVVGARSHGDDDLRRALRLDVLHRQGDLAHRIIGEEGSGSCAAMYGRTRHRCRPPSWRFACRKSQRSAGIDGRPVAFDPRLRSCDGILKPGSHSSAHRQPHSSPARTRT